VRLIQTVRRRGLRASHHVTFRSRVITATVAAAAIAVILACFASFLTTRNSLIHSVDEFTPRRGDAERRRSRNKLRSVPRAPDGPDGTAADGPDGTFVENSRRRDDPGRRQGQEPAGLSHRRHRREQLPRAHRAHRGQFKSGRARTSTPVCIKTTSAELFITNIDGQVNELRNLVRTLTFVAIGGLLLALGLGLFLARTALRPLER